MQSFCQLSRVSPRCDFWRESLHELLDCLLSFIMPTHRAKAPVNLKEAPVLPTELYHDSDDNLPAGTLVWTCTDQLPKREPGSPLLPPTVPTPGTLTISNSNQQG